MTDAGYVELARHAADRLGQPDATRPTSGYRNHPGRPTGLPPHTIDRGYLSGELVPALTAFEVCDTPGLRAISDHLPQRATFDTAVLREILHRPARVYEPNTLASGPLPTGGKPHE